MGLNVVSNTTFGALSEGELALALSTALPINLDPIPLRKWIVEKKNAQIKLKDYLTNAAIFMGTPGNTRAGWMDSQRVLQSRRDDSGDQGGETPGTFLGFE